MHDAARCRHIANGAVCVENRQLNLPAFPLCRIGSSRQLPPPHASARRQHVWTGRWKFVYVISTK